MLSSADSITSDMPLRRRRALSRRKPERDGFFYESGNLCLRRTQGDVTLIAARPTTEVYAVRSAAVLSFGAALACIMICGVAAYLLRLDPVTSDQEEMDVLESAQTGEAMDQPRELEAAMEMEEERPREEKKTQTTTKADRGRSAGGDEDRDRSTAGTATSACAKADYAREETGV